MSDFKGTRGSLRFPGLELGHCKRAHSPIERMDIVEMSLAASSNPKEFLGISVTSKVFKEATKIEGMIWRYLDL